jgi:hypothetical protein
MGRINSSLAKWSAQHFIVQRLIVIPLAKLSSPPLRFLVQGPRAEMVFNQDTGSLTKAFSH